MIAPITEKFLNARPAEAENFYRFAKALCISYAMLTHLCQAECESSWNMILVYMLSNSVIGSMEEVIYDVDSYGLKQLTSKFTTVLHVIRKSLERGAEDSLSFWMATMIMISYPALFENNDDAISLAWKTTLMAIKPLGTYILIKLWEIKLRFAGRSRNV